MCIYVELNNDYSPGPYAITFPAGRKSISFNISITNDNVLEGNEMFNLTVRITNSLILSRVNTGNVSQVAVTILDNDRMLNYICTSELKLILLSFF